MTQRSGGTQRRKDSQTGSPPLSRSQHRRSAHTNVSRPILAAWAAGKQLNPNVSDAVHLHQQRLLSSLSARLIPGAQTGDCVLPSCTVASLCARPVPCEPSTGGTASFPHDADVWAHVQLFNKDQSWHNFLIEARTQLARGNIFDYDQCRFDSTGKAAAGRLRKALTQQPRDTAVLSFR
jgi:hypothetical protein